MNELLPTTRCAEIKIKSSFCRTKATHSSDIINKAKSTNIFMSLNKLLKLNSCNLDFYLKIGRLFCYSLYKLFER